jgi:hypothetical protein
MGSTSSPASCKAGNGPPLAVPNLLAPTLDVRIEEVERETFFPVCDQYGVLRPADSPGARRVRPIRSRVTAGFRIPSIGSSSMTDLERSAMVVLFLIFLLLRESLILFLAESRMRGHEDATSNERSRPAH